MKVALFSDTYLPQLNGVSRTLHLLSAHLEQRGVEHLIFAPTPALPEGNPRIPGRCRRWGRPGKRR